MDIAERLARERRGRLAAERLLEQKSRELSAANEKLALHARSLSDQLVQQRHVVHAALSEAEVLKGQNSRFLTDLEHAHTAAMTAEERLWEAINTVADGFALFDANRRLVAANRAYQGFFGDDPVPLGTPYDEVLRRAFEKGMIDPRGQPAAELMARLLAAWQETGAEPVEVPMMNGDWVRRTGRRTADGGLVSLVQDITDQMRIWTALEAIPEGFVLYDRDERFLSCNQRYRDMYAAGAPAMVPGTRFEDILRESLKQGLHIDALGREEAWLADRLAAHRAASGMLEQQLSDGRWIRAYDHATPDGGRVGLRLDITAEKAQKAALEAARAAAEAANRAKSTFLANMSHEIRTPMNGVVGMAELLCDTGLNEEQRLFAETIRSSGEALLVIINDILDYSKIEAERLTLRPEPFDLERTIHEVAMLLQPRAKARGIELMIDFDLFLPTLYVGDPGRLRQILTNLIGNAVKFSEAGHVLVRVVGIETIEAGRELHITVEDTGIGIAKEHLDHVFGEFHQVESDANRKFEGTGLGLAITRRLVERMGGAVWVESVLGEGACFGFRLALPVAEDPGAVGSALPVKRAIVVDGQFINRTILERQLVPCGVAVTLCRSGAEALEVLAVDRAFDVVLTDDALPDMAGLEFAARLRAAGIALPVILLAGDPLSVRDSGQAEALAGIVPKPVLRSELYRKLQALAAPAPVARPVVVPEVAGERRLMRVLAAEDNRTNQLVFRKMVKNFAIDLEFANNGLEAVERFQSFVPDLIFMDISMPEMDGRDAARAIRALEAGNSHVPICALTAHAMDGDAEGILAAGIDQYLTKPLRRAAIAEALSAACPADAVPPVGNLAAGEAPHQAQVA